MSGFDPALINLVSPDMLKSEDILDLDYHISSRNLRRRDALNLVGRNGEPSATPMRMGIKDLDHKYAYVDGSVGSTMRLKTYNPTFAIDWISGAARAKLQQWMYNRKRLMLSPNMSERTIFSYRAMRQFGYLHRDSGNNNTDLAHGLALYSYQANDSMYWDWWLKCFKGPFASNVNCVVSTPGGAGLLTSRSHRNRMIPSYPHSAGQGPGDGNSGWTHGGSDYADITATLITNGFAHNSCPHSLRIQTSDLVSADRKIYMEAAWDSGHGGFQGYSFSGSGYASLTLWIKGRLPAGAYLALEQIGGNNENYLFDNEDFSDWRPVSLAVYSTNWATADPRVTLFLNTTSADPADFEIGPYWLDQNNGSYNGAQPQWRDHSDAFSGNSFVQAYSMQPAKSGCWTASAYVPKGMANRNQRIGFIGGEDHGMDAYCVTTNGEWTFRFTTTTGGTHYYTATLQKIFSDEVLVFSFQYGAGRRAMYVNGEKIGEWTSGDDMEIDTVGPSDVYIGLSTNNTDILPMALLTVRHDEQVFTDNEIKYLHSSLRDPGALAVSIPARGRLFEIVEIPSTPRPSPHGTEWVGRLKLKQVEYDPDTADMTAKDTTTF